MLKLQRQLAELQNHMYDSVMHNFNKVSGLHDNGMTPPQMQDGDQTVEIDIATIYPLWSTDTDDWNYIDQMTNYKSIKDIRD